MGNLHCDRNILCDSEPKRLVEEVWPEERGHFGHPYHAEALGEWSAWGAWACYSTAVQRAGGEDVSCWFLLALPKPSLELHK